MTATYYVGDALEVMGKLPEKSVDLVLTSPPFLALRSYLPANHPDKALEGGSQLTPGAYIDWLIDVVEACDRVLAPHGSLCFELGDTYAGSGGGGGDYNTDGLRKGQPRFRPAKASPDQQSHRKMGDGEVLVVGGTGWPLAKSLSLIPELFRFSLVYGQNPLTGRQTERWRLRNVIRWVRPNPPVGALGDKFRPATSELMVFCKSSRRFFDLDAVRESNPRVDEAPRVGRNSAARMGQGGDWSRGPDSLSVQNPAGAPPLDWWNIPLLGGEEPTKYGPKERPTTHARTAKGVESVPRSGKSADRGGVGNWASLRELHETQESPPLDWWNIPPGGYSGAHYAVWPPELLIKPIKAMCPEKVCRVCGEARRRIVENPNGGLGSNEWNRAGTNSGKAIPLKVQERPHMSERITLGFSDCGHDDYRPGLVLDPFAGSGTTLLVATGHGRDAIGIDLDERNWDLALERVGPFMLERGKL